MAFTPQHPQHGGDDLQTGRFETFLRRLFSIKRAGLLRSINPGVEAGIDLLAGVTMDQLALVGWRQYSSCPTVGPTAAQQSVHSFYNPPGSGIIAVFRGWQGYYNPTSQAAWFLSPADQTGLGASPAWPMLDLRQNRGGTTVTQNCGLTVRAGTQAALSGSTAVLDGFSGVPFSTTGRSLWNAPFTPEGLLVLPPGWCVGLTTTTLNATLSSQVVWMERNLEPSELGPF